MSNHNGEGEVVTLYFHYNYLSKGNLSSVSNKTQPNGMENRKQSNR